MLPIALCIVRESITLLGCRLCILAASTDINGIVALSRVCQDYDAVSGISWSFLSKLAVDALRGRLSHNEVTSPFLAS